MMDKLVIGLIHPSLEWPINSHHEYLTGYTFFVTSEVTAPGNNQIIHPVEISYREEVDS